jgi:peptide/nickel transport system permease protein
VCAQTRDTVGTGQVDDRGSPRARLIRQATPRLKVGIAILLLLVLIAVGEPILTDYRLDGRSPGELGMFDPNLPPSLDNPLGTDLFGRDLLAQVMIGLRFSLIVGFAAGFLATAFGVFVALFGGYSRGWVDDLLSMVTLAVLVTPSLPVLIALAAFAEFDLWTLTFALAFFSWPWPARIIRAQVLSLRERPYVEFARVSGFGRLRIIFAELLPNLVPFVVVGLSYAIIGSMLAETGLRLLGLGAGEVVSLGLLLNRAMGVGALARGDYPMVLPPMLCLVLVFAALSLINAGLEERFNPRLKGVTGE